MELIQRTNLLGYVLTAHWQTLAHSAPLVYQLKYQMELTAH